MSKLTDPEVTQTTNETSTSDTSFLTDFKSFSYWVGIPSVLILIPFSVALPFTWVQLSLWILILLPIALAWMIRLKGSNLNRGTSILLVLTSLPQLIVLVSLLLGFFIDTTQTPTHLESMNLLELQPLNDSTSEYFVETNTHYEVYVKGDWGPRLFSYPKSKTTIQYETVQTPTIETFNSCSHHWIESLINKVTPSETHLKLQTSYVLRLPSPTK